MVIESRILKFVGIAGLTIYPFIFIMKGLTDNQKITVLKHENVHKVQQGKWFAKAWYFGLIAWFLLYRFALPIVWNPFVRKWETEAYRANGLSDETINEVLKGWPYFIFF